MWLLVSKLLSKRYSKCALAKESDSLTIALSDIYTVRIRYLSVHLGKGERGFVGGRGNSCCRATHSQSGSVHHLEHVSQSPMFGAHQIPATIVVLAENDMGGAVAFLPHLLKITGTGDIVGCAVQSVSGHH